MNEKKNKTFSKENLYELIKQLLFISRFQNAKNNVIKFVG